MEATTPYSKLFVQKPQPNKPKWWEILLFIGLIIYIIGMLIWKY